MACFASVHFVVGAIDVTLTCLRERDHLGKHCLAHYDLDISPEPLAKFEWD